MKKKIIDSAEFKELLEILAQVRDSGENHPKLKKLSEILSSYFSKAENIANKSRVMIFTQNRASAIEINQYLQKIENVNSSIFVGQTKFKNSGDNETDKFQKPGDWNQKKQLAVLEKFKNFELNTLIATCIGEEGLDIGEIDLIICYDSGFSPVRMVQRMGRTGRKREGKVIVLLMEGKEYFVYKASLKRNQRLKKGLKSTSHASTRKRGNQKTNGFKFYEENPRMLPESIIPQLKFVDEIDEVRLSQKFDGRRDDEMKSEVDEGLEEIMNFTKVNENSIMQQLRFDQIYDDFEDCEQEENEKIVPAEDTKEMLENPQENENQFEYDSLMAEEEICGRDFDDEEDLDLEEIDRMLAGLEKESQENSNQDSKKRQNPYYESLLDQSKKSKTMY